MTFFKRVLVFMGLFTLLGDVIAMITAPSVLEWYQTPAIGTSLCNCAEASRSASEGYLHFQLAGMAIGAVVGLVLGIVVVRAWSRREAAHATVAASATPTAPAA